MPTKLSAIGSVAVLAAVLVTFAAPTPAFATAAGRGSSSVDAVEVYVTTVAFDVITVETSMAGGDWADSTYHMVASIYDLGAGQYRFDLSVADPSGLGPHNSQTAPGPSRLGGQAPSPAEESLVLSRAPPAPSCPATSGPSIWNATTMATARVLAWTSWR